MIIYFSPAHQQLEKNYERGKSKFMFSYIRIGGRNHTIVDQTADLNDTVEKIIWSKFLNAGQTCIACNHVFIHKNIKHLFYKNV